MGDHEVSGDILDRFAAHTATGEEERQVLYHILAGCRKCLRYLRLAGWKGLASEEGGNVVPLGPPAGSYDEVFAAAERSAKVALQRRHMKDLLTEIDVIPAEERELRIRNLRRYHVAKLAAALVEKSFELRYSDVPATLHYARLAVAAAEGAAREPEAESKNVADCRARAWAQLGNAHRIDADFTEAERCFRRAIRYLGAGTGAGDIRAWVLRLHASLRVAQRSFAAAIKLNEEAVRIYRSLSDRTGEAAALIGVAQARLCAGDPAPAIPALQRALKILEPWHEQERALVRVASISLVCCYVDIGCVQRAYDLASMAEDHFEDCPDRIARLHWKWQLGKVDRERGDFFAANYRLTFVRDGLLEAQLPEQTGEVLLDLAILYARQGRRTEFLRAMADAATLFNSLGAHREFLAALAQLGKMAKASRAAEGLLRQLVLQCRGGVERAES